MSVITSVQHRAILNPTSGSAYGFSPNNAITKGDLLIAYILSNHPPAVSNPIADSLGNVWNLSINYTAVTNVWDTIWWAVAASSGVDTFTYQTTGGNSFAFGFSQWHSDTYTSWKQDVAGVGNRDNTPTTQKSTAVNTNFAPEVVFSTWHLFGVYSSQNTPFSAFDNANNQAGASYDIPTTTQSGLQNSINTNNNSIFTIQSFYGVFSGVPNSLMMMGAGT